MLCSTGSTEGSVVSVDQGMTPVTRGDTTATQIDTGSGLDTLASDIVERVLARVIREEQERCLAQDNSDKVSSINS